MIEVRSLERDMYEEWYVLWQGYLTFYQAELPDHMTQLTWERLHEADTPMFGVGAFLGGRLVGIAHYLFHRSTWAEHEYCYMEDLFTDEKVRGHGVGRALIDEIYDIAQAKQCQRMYWSTHVTNNTARHLYDKIGDNSGFIQYRKKL